MIMRDKRIDLLEEVEKSFAKVVKEIKKGSVYTESRIKEALKVLYKEIGIDYPDPMEDWQNDYLTLNAGRRTKEILNYLSGNEWKGISLKSLRLIDKEELEKEIC